MAISAFAVVSEFKFDVAGAILGLDALENRLEGVSNAATNALGSVKSLGIGLVATFSGAGGGVLSFLTNALMVSDKFTQSQLSFVQIIDSNMEHLSGSINGINEQMLTSRKIMDDIAKDSIKFGLPAQDLLSMTKTLSAMLVPKGLAGDNFSGARTMSRNLLKSAPNLGIDPGMVQGQLLRAIEGSASMGDTLFRRLISEAPEAFKQANVKDAKGFNALKAAERFNILNDALGKFANNAGILEMRANTLAGTMQTIRDLFTSFTSVLKPIGDVLMPLLINVLQMGINFLNTEGRRFIESFAIFLKSFMSSPKEMLLDLMSLQNLSGNIAKSAGFVGLIVGLTHLQLILGAFAGIPFLGAIAGFFAGIFAFVMKIPIIGGLLTGFMGIFKTGPAVGALGTLKVFGITLLRMAGLFGILLIPITGIMRAIDRMKLQSIVWLMDNMSSLMDTLTEFRMALSKMFVPITDMIKGWEDLFFTILSGNGTLISMKWLLEAVVSGFSLLGNFILNWWAGMRAVIAAVFGFIGQMILNIMSVVENIMSGNFLSAFSGVENPFKEAFANGAEEFMKTINRFRTPTLGPDGVDDSKVSNLVVNNNINMNNNFKEVLNPDRIAFTIQEQLEKASIFRTSSRASGIAAIESRAKL